MTGNNYSKKNQRGQVLLITVMLLATVLTVVFAISFKSTTDSQTAKLEEESQKALAAAEAGLEEAIRSGNVDAAHFPVAGFTGAATVTSLASNTFTSPLLQQDDQYTFYLSTPPSANNHPDFTGSLTSSYNNTALTICFGTVSPPPVLELTLVKSAGVIQRFLINPTSDSTNHVANGTDANGSGSCPTGETFSDKHQLSVANVGSNNLLLFVRVIGMNSSTKIGFTGGANLPVQGQTISSTATSQTGVTKKIQLFQSYPQIPSDFFVTNF